MCPRILFYIYLWSKRLNFVLKKSKSLYPSVHIIHVHWLGFQVYVCL
jgi:hypothetical protein